MGTESEIQNFKKILIDETRGYALPDVVEKVFDETFEMFEKVRNHGFQDKEEAVDKFLEMLAPAEVVEFLKRHPADKGASPEESFRNGVRIGKAALHALANENAD